MTVILKCKMCGGDMHIIESAGICECEYCGSRQTIPLANDEKRTNLFNRANRLRMACEFDKAAGIYESLIAEFSNEAEAYWGLCMCKYGIEYVDDPKTAEKIPTCHRTSYIRIFDDADYKQAIANADEEQIRIYDTEAHEIDRLQVAILDVVRSENPYDVFICYKETDENGERTKDSVLSQNIYDSLTGSGLKVFFSRITLESKLGQEYEPYIFSALNSARVMLVVGTSYDNMNSVWVKNEWSRFLELVKKDKDKILIPCYAGIDAYDLPDEFRNLQGQDLSKLGAVQDITRGITKILGKKETSNPMKSDDNTNALSLVKRGYISLDDREWSEAGSFFEQALNVDPENSDAYIGLLLVRTEVPNLEMLSESQIPIRELGEYRKALRFANSSAHKVIENAATRIENRIKEEEKEMSKAKARKMKRSITIAACVAMIVGIVCGGMFYYQNIYTPAYQYKQAIAFMDSGNYDSAIEIFTKLGEYEDCNEKIQACENLKLMKMIQSSY